MTYPGLLYPGTSYPGEVYVPEAPPAGGTDDVREPAALVLINGAPHDVESVSVSRELTSTMPAQTAAVSGLMAATGDVTWAVGDDVQSRSAHPWDGNSFPPKPSDEVLVYMGYGENLTRQLTGMVDKTLGSVADGDVSSDVVDRIDKLSQPVSFPAFMGVMPPWEENGSFVLAGSEPTFFTDRVLRACGFNATPPIDNGCVLSVPLMGSAWPERGRLDVGSQRDRDSFPPSFNASHWGMAVNSINASYTPEISYFGNNRLDKTFQITLKARRVTASAGDTVVRAWWGTDRVTIGFTSDRTVVASINNGGTYTQVCTMSTGAAWTADTFTLRVTAAGVFTIYANNGNTSTGSVSLPSSMTGANLTRVQVLSEHITSMHIGGLQVGFTTNATWESEQTATLTPSAYSFGLPGFPRIEGRNALDVLKEQAEAECAAMWINEQGHFRWVNREVLVSADPTATLTALDDVFEIGWESSASGVRSKVILKSQEAVINRSDVSNLLAWQGGGGSLESGQETEEIVTPDTDVDWISVDESMAMVLDTAAGWPDRFNWGHGSWAGAIESDDDAETWVMFNNPSFSVDLEKVADSVYKITTDAGSPRSGFNVELRTPAEDSTTVVRKSKREFNLPVLRAKAIIEWIDRTTTGVHSGPENAAALEHEVGPWIQEPAELQRLADWLSSQVSTPRPVLRNLSVVPDFSRELGDIVWVEDEENMRLRLKVLVTSITNSVSSGSAEQTVGGRILEAQPYGATNAQLDEHAAGYTNAGFDTLWADASNAQLDTDPLGRG